MIVITAVLVFGLSTTLWSVVGVVRMFAERRDRGGSHRLGKRARIVPPTPGDVAILILAHNEELLIEATIASAGALVPMANVHVVSDGSTDATAAVSRRAGAQVLDLQVNRGKAGALGAGLDYFKLYKDFEVVLLLDADSRLAPDYLTTGLPLFADPEVVAVAGRAVSTTYPPPATLMGEFLLAYRQRLYVIVQVLLKYGQAARGANVVPIIPGFASMYRSSVLAKIDVAAPGLVVEDFNMTFEIHAKQLGRIAFHPRAAVAYTQDPDTLSDYMSQYRRWTLGFWQTVRRHHPRPGRFWAALSLHMVELLTNGAFLILLVPSFFVWILAAIVADLAAIASGPIFWMAHLELGHLMIGVLLPDYAMTIFTAILCRRPRYLLLGLAFPLMRVVDSAICLRALPRAWSTAGTGIWKSPTRRPTATATSAPVPVSAPAATSWPDNVEPELQPAGMALSGADFRHGSTRASSIDR